MKISTREIILGISTLALILFGATYWMAGTAFEEQRDMKEQKIRLKRQIKLHNRILDERESWIDQLNELQALVPVYNARTPVSVELPKTIKRIADKHQLDLPLTQPQGEKQVGSLSELKVRCDWQGTIEQLTRFLYDLHEQGIRYDVRQISVKPIAKLENQLKGSMIINCAYRRAEENL
jgi:hypothetical protein